MANRSPTEKASSRSPPQSSGEWEALRTEQESNNVSVLTVHCEY